MIHNPRHAAYVLHEKHRLTNFKIMVLPKKTMDLMFSYPINRRKILFSQIAAVWIFGFASLLFCKLWLCVFLTLTRPITGIVTTDILSGALPYWLDMIVSSAAMVSISYISLLTGMLKKSSKTAIVTSVIIACFTQGNIGEATLSGSVPFYALLMAFALLSVYFSVCHAETKDLR